MVGTKFPRLQDLLTLMSKAAVDFCGLLQNFEWTNVLTTFVLGETSERKREISVISEPGNAERAWRNPFIHGSATVLLH